MAGQLEIKLVRGTAGKTQRIKKVLHGLGLRKINQVVKRQNTPDIRGMVYEIIQYVEVKTL